MAFFSLCRRLSQPSIAIDHHRTLRRGFPEVVLCQGKTVDQVVTLLRKIAEGHRVFLATRVDLEMAQAIREQIPSLRYNPVARILHGPLTKRTSRGPLVLVVSAGTSDIPVAEEAAKCPSRLPFPR